MFVHQIVSKSIVRRSYLWVELCQFSRQTVDLLLWIFANQIILECSIEQTKHIVWLFQYFTVYNFMGIFTTIFRILRSIFSCFPFRWCINYLQWKNAIKNQIPLSIECKPINWWFLFTIIIQKSASGLKNSCNVFCVLMQYTLSSAVNVLLVGKKFKM